MGDGINDFLVNNQNLGKQIASQVASITLERTGEAAGARLAAELAGKVIGKTAAALVDPAIWIASGNAPDGVDFALWSTGLFGGMVAYAAAGVGVIKAIVDDDIDVRLKQAAGCEPTRYRPFIKAAAKFGMSGETINALSIAAGGGTVWRHPNGLWVFITDAKGRLVCDYQPAVANEVLQPILPLRWNGNGFRWHKLQGGGSFGLYDVALLEKARAYFMGHKEAVGVLLVNGQQPMFLKSGEDGGPWGGTQRGGVPRMSGWAFTQGGASQGNIATHVEGHASAIMWQRNLTDAHLLVDRAMCDVCSRLLANTLPPGSRLRVESIDEGLTVVSASHAR